MLMSTDSSGLKTAATLLLTYDRKPLSNISCHQKRDTKHTILISPMSSDEHYPSAWRFLTNHTQVLLCIARTPDIRLRDVAEQVGITERAAQRIVADLVEAGFVDRERHGR